MASFALAGTLEEPPEEEATSGATPQYIYEPSAGEIFAALLPRYVETLTAPFSERIRLRAGQQNFESTPDDHVLKIQAQMTF